jgi:predicted transcriptional regulator
MSQKRSKNQIIAQVLALCQGDGASKTKIVYQANLNFGSVKTHLGLLQEKGLLEATPDVRPIYKTTPKGEIALERLRVVEEIYS